ncbi:MAG: SurA N-terminal domain-containing protein [Deltaproteobacteria bacterium]|jgi:uncharacterized protein YneF (UPF0154 family)|nr:SurA N-terminal domain-containing protein [Deltaproteobacteria bacterium]
MGLNPKEVSASPMEFPRSHVRKSFIWLLVFISLGVCVVVGTFLFRHYYQRQLWDPATAALVNGQPIYRSALEAMMRAGLNPRPADQPKAALTIRQILDRLIDEELARQEVEKAGILTSDAELANIVAAIQSSWPCQDSLNSSCQPSPGPELDQFLKAARLRNQLEKLAQKVIPGQRRPSSQNWRSFWRAWLARMPKSQIYKVEVLFMSKVAGARDLLTKALKKNPTIEELETEVRLEGLATLRSRVMSLNPLDPEARNLLGQERLWEVLAAHGRPTPYLVGPFESPNSWAVVEILEIRPAPEADLLALAAQKAYELQTGQTAFKAWLAQIRSQAIVVINPNYPDLGQTQVAVDTVSR